MAAPIPFRFPDKGSRVLAEFNRQRAIERLIAADQKRIARQFAGAAVSRLTSSMQSWSGSINSDLDGSLAILRARARQLAQDNEYGRRFLSLVANNVAGPTGPTLQVRAYQANGKSLDTAANNVIEAHWARWGKKAEITGRMSFAHALRVITKSVARDGEALVRVVRDRTLPYGMALQLLEADRLDDGINQRLSSGNVIRMGVEMDSVGRPVAYHIKTAHPGEHYATGAMTVERVLARDVYHLFLPERAEQVRGYSWFHAVLMRAAMLHGFEEAAVIAARVGAQKVGVFERDPNADPDAIGQLADGESAEGVPQMSAEPGEFITLPNGYKLASWDPDYPHGNFDSFVKTCQRGLAVGLDVATHNLSGDMTQVNYSSARIAEMSEREFWTMLQEWFIDSLVIPVFRDWLQAALISAAITFDSGSVMPATRFQKFADASRFQGRRWAWFDPLKDAQASRELISLKLASRTEIAAAMGRDFEDIVADQAQEQQIMADAGVDSALPTGASSNSDAEGDANA